jgi:hypothetical protein
MKIFVGFDDTDTLDCGRGTGKLARWYADKLPSGCSSLGVVRQQLLFSPEIPMTSHNSSLCVIVDAPDLSYTEYLTGLAIKHINEFFIEGSDPGLCVVAENNSSIANLAEFGIKCTHTRVAKEDAEAVASDCHLSEHGGTGMGKIGSVAAVGLTWRGDSGRFVDFGRIRELPELTTVGELTKMGINVISVNRHGEVPAPDERVNNFGSLRPLLFSGRPVLPVISSGVGTWKVIIEKTVYPS